MFHWNMDSIDKLYFDDNDIYGLEYWYHFVDEVTKPKKDSK